MDGQMDRWTDSPCVLQDFVPFGAADLLPLNLNHSLLKQGTGTADHLLPLGCYFFFLSFFLLFFFPLFPYSFPLLFFSWPLKPSDWPPTLPSSGAARCSTISASVACYVTLHPALSVCLSVHLCVCLPVCQSIRPLVPHFPFYFFGIFGRFGLTAPAQIPH